MTVRAWADQWLELYPREGVSTRRNYTEGAKRIVALIGNQPLKDIDRLTVRDLLGKLPPSAVAIARTMWSDAVRDGLVASNPWTNLRLRKSRGRRDIEALTPTEIDRLCEIAREQCNGYGIELAAIIQTLAYTGIRPGELMALRWNNINGSLQVQRTRVVDGTEKLPKNGLKRTIVLAPQAAAALGTVERNGSPYVFHSPRGKPLNKASLHRAWAKVRDAWVAEGGSDIDLYELRHACATMLRDAGLQPDQVAIQLGHTDGGRLVATVYGHPSEQAAQEAIKTAFTRIGDHS